MKKLSVITVLNTVNYGSALQTFATQKYFTDKGFEVEFVDYWRKDQKTEARIENIKKDNAELEQPKQYDFDKNTFVVKPVFKENSTDTLGTVLLRLMTDGK